MDGIAIITIISCMIVIFFMVVNYEFKFMKMRRNIEKLSENRTKLAEINEELITIVNEVMMESDIFIELLKEHYTMREIEEFYNKKINEYIERGWYKDNATNR